MDQPILDRASQAGETPLTIKPRTPLMSIYKRHAGVFQAFALVRLPGQRGRPTPCIVAAPGDPRAAVEAKLGAIAAFDVTETEAGKAPAGEFRDPLKARTAETAPG